jgi:phage gp36-like protein
MSKPVCESHEVCPLMNKKRVLVCHKCAWFIHVRGKNPQTDEDMDKWECAVAMLPLLMIENARVSTNTNAAIVSLRNDIVDVNNRRMTVDLSRTSALIKSMGRS